jgi:hypothetical protein
MNDKLSVLCSTGNLGDTPIEEGTFYEGIKRNPDYLGADAGSSDLGPTFLGSDTAHNPVEWEKHDLEIMLLEARRLDIPMIIGSCGSTGTDRGVNLFLELIKEIADEHKIKPFTLAAIRSEIQLDILQERIIFEKVMPLEAENALTAEDIKATSHVTAAMGVEQIIHAFSRGAKVIIAGRCCDDAVFAAYPIFMGFPKALALHMGKAIECASLVGFPQKVKESVLGTITHNEFYLEPMHSDQSITPHSVAAHSMYERMNPFLQEVPDGTLDMHKTQYEAHTPRICRISGSKFVPNEGGKYRVKLEGAGDVGYRVFHVVGIRDSIAVRHINKILADTRQKVADIFNNKAEDKDYQLFFHVYGVNGVMGQLEPLEKILSHEVGILIEVISPDLELATSIAKLAKFRFFYAHYPGQRNSSGGGAAILVDEPLFPKNKAYRWTISHLLRLDDPLDKEIFRFKFLEIGK